MSTSKQTSSGISLMGLLFITFLVLKLTDVIDWSWWWVTVPLWGGTAIVLAIAAFLFLVAVVFHKRR